MIYVAYALSVAAILVMLVDVVLALRLKKAILGGEVGQKWGLLTNLVLVFFVGYLLSPALVYLVQTGALSFEVLSTLVFAVFLFGALFVLVVIGIVRDALGFLDLIKE